MILGQDKEQARKKEFKIDKIKKGNRKYGQAKRRHAKRGVYSLMMAILVIIVFVVLVLTAFLHKGQSSAIIGSFGLFTMILSGVGVVIGARGFRERDKNYATCKWGVGLNGLILVSLLSMFVRGIG